ncbi:MAG: cyclic pyranopterin monophosphate synthase MoaC [Bacteroidales bacterium]|nr:cyclic pyranopterin monophosphate synthase MoaC [Bacteroidales bacterium]MDD4030133.1 cyclic pyranopterin monophosphate synthase MoaC [Bacteroidales bacterium]MDD4435528.1 cyclic pyranopterin monophosphate synthase MoaC [Bacteroidales bacterium]
MKQPETRKQELSHTRQDGRIHMVDTSSKENSLREAKACGSIALSSLTIQLIKEDRIKKGSVLTTAALAGISAAKLCGHLIPLCHNIPLSMADVTFTVHPDSIEAFSEVRCTGPTGVEMEALTAVSMALLTIYDMCKAVDKHMEITGIRLLEKTKKSLHDHDENPVC